MGQAMENIDLIFTIFCLAYWGVSSIVKFNPVTKAVVTFVIVSYIAISFSRDSFSLLHIFNTQL